MSNMEKNLLKSLNVIEASNRVMDDVSREHKLNFDRETGEIFGDPHAFGGLDPDEDEKSYQPLMEVPEIKAEDRESKVPVYENSDAQTDYQRVRATTYAVQEAVLVMMSHAAKLAANTESPAIFRVFKELGELNRGCNKDLMDNQRMIRDVTKDREPEVNDQTTVGVRTNPDGTVDVTMTKGAPRSSRDLLKVVQQIRDEKRGEQADRQEVSDAEIAEPAPTEVEDDGLSKA